MQVTSCKYNPDLYDSTESVFTVCPAPTGTECINSISLAHQEYQHHRLDFALLVYQSAARWIISIRVECTEKKNDAIVTMRRRSKLLSCCATEQLGWERYKKALCQEIGTSLFILGTCFHSYINVVEVRRSGIPVSDLLHELCSSHIDFHPTLKRGKNLKNNTSRCKPSRRYCGNHERAKCVGNAADKKRTEGKKSLWESAERFCDDMSSYAPEVRLRCQCHKPQSMTAAEANS